MPKTSNVASAVVLVGSVPVRPTMLAYLCFKEGIQPNELVDLRGSGHIKNYLKDLLCNKTEMLQSRIKSKEFAATYSTYLKIAVTVKMEHFYRFFISREGVVVFDRFLYSLMINDLNVAILIGVQLGKTEKQIIEEYLRMLGIEEQIEHESLKRACTRYRTRQNQKNLHEIRKTRKGQ